MNKTFKAALLGALLLAGSLWQSTTAVAAELKKVKVSVQTIVDCVPLVVAMKQGYFAEEGLEIDTSTSAGGAVGIPGLVAGAYDIALSNVVSSILALNQGLDVQVIAPGAKMSPTHPTSEMVGRKADAYKTATDFNGKSIAVNTRNGIIWLYARAWVKARGGDPDKVTYREVPYAQMEDAIKRRNVDAAFMVEPFKSYALKNAEFGVVGSVFNEVQPGADAGNYISTNKFVAANPDTVVKFTKALRRGIEWYNANQSKPETLQIVSDFTRLPVPVLKEIVLPPMPTKVDVAQLRKTAELMREHGMFTAAPDVTKYVNRLAVN